MGMFDGMERMTRKEPRHGYYYFPKCFEEPCLGQGSSEKCDSCDYHSKQCIALGKYEDTGLTPEQIQEIKRKFNDQIMPRKYQMMQKRF